MDSATFNYLVENQTRFRHEYIESTKINKKIRRLLSSQYPATRNKNYSKERIKKELIELLDLTEDEIKENDAGYLYVDYICKTRF